VHMSHRMALLGTPCVKPQSAKGLYNSGVQCGPKGPKIWYLSSRTTKSGLQQSPGLHCIHWDRFPHLGYKNLLRQPAPSALVAIG
jgi:hypothetical protein